MEITTFDKATAKAFHEAVRKAIEKTAAEYGVDLGRSSGRFSDNEFKIRFAFATKRAKTARNEKIADALPMWAKAYGLPDGVKTGTVFTHLGLRYEIVGLDTRKRKFPIIVKQLANGKQYKVAPEMVKRALAVA